MVSTWKPFLTGSRVNIPSKQSQFFYFARTGTMYERLRSGYGDSRDLNDAPRSCLPRIQEVRLYYVLAPTTMFGWNLVCRHQLHRVESVPRHQSNLKRCFITPKYSSCHIDPFGRARPSLTP